jgi:hypothetical protein
MSICISSLGTPTMDSASAILPATRRRFLGTCWITRRLTSLTRCRIPENIDGLVSYKDGAVLLVFPHPSE